MKVQDDRCSIKPTFTRVKDIPSGTVFVGDIGGARSVFLRGGERNSMVVDLKNPNNYWTSADYISVQDYQPVHGRIVIERNA